MNSPVLTWVLLVLVILAALYTSGRLQRLFGAIFGD